MQKKKIMLILLISLITIAWGSYNGYGQVIVKIPDVKVNQDTVIFVPIIVTDLSNYSIISYQFNVYYDSLVIKARGVSVENTLTSQWGSAAANIDSVGKIVVGAFGVSPLMGSDTLLKLVFDIIAQPEDSTLIVLGDFQFNNGDPKVITQNGWLEVILSTGIRDQHLSVMPQELTLLKNYPEPFYDQTRILVHLSQPDQAQIEIVNILGQRIKQFENFPMKTGDFSIDWNATDNRGTRVLPGIYFCVVKQDNKIIGVDRMILVK
jgi:hypothetical protein